MAITSETISGARLELNGTTVRKHCANAEEQVYHMARLPPIMDRPEIYRLGMGFYDMAYVRGPTLLELSTDSRKRALAVLDEVLGVINYNRIGTTRVLTAAYNDKIANVMVRTEDKILSHEIERMWIELVIATPVITLPMGPVHGDLTPENIICAGKGLQYIDGIPSPIPTVLQDVAKLRQEYVYGWSEARHGLQYNRKAFADMVASRFGDSIEQRIVDFVTIARIAPYAKTWKVKQWIREALGRVSSYSQPVAANVTEIVQRHY